MFGVILNLKVRKPKPLGIVHKQARQLLPRTYLLVDESWSVKKFLDGRGGMILVVGDLRRPVSHLRNVLSFSGGPRVLEEEVGVRTSGETAVGR